MLGLKAYQLSLQVHRAPKSLLEERKMYEEDILPLKLLSVIIITTEFVPASTDSS